MRLYVNTKEVPFLKDALNKVIAQSNTPIEIDRLSDLLERVKLCEELQKQERRAKREEFAENVVDHFLYHDDDPTE